MMTDPPLFLTALPLRFHGIVERPIALNEHKGSAIRGALFHALRGRPGTERGFCLRKDLTSCHPCELVSVCPISALVANVSEASVRGIDPPRPLTIEPPLSAQTHFESGVPFSFGLTLFGDAMRLLPYVVSALNEFQTGGIGQNVRSTGVRGTIRLSSILALNPFVGGTEELLTDGSSVVRQPQMRITSADVELAAGRLDGSKAVTLDLLTPTRLTDHGRLVQRMSFRPLFHRLIERCLALTNTVVDTRPLWPLLELARDIRIEVDHTRWVELDSYSTRRNARAPLSGLVGSVTFSGDLAPFLPWLVWGQVTHVGKEATKGNGWYRMR